MQASDANARHSRSRGLSAVNIAEMPETRLASLTVMFAVLLSTSTAILGAGQAASEKTIADGVYSAAQADRGEQRFKTSCSSCHTPGSFGGGAFADRWNGQTMGEVFDFVSNAMPENDPGGLAAEDYANVLAFILKVNGYKAGDNDLPSKTAELKAFKIAPVPR